MVDILFNWCKCDVHINETCLSHNNLIDDDTIDNADVVSVPIASSSANTILFLSAEYIISLNSFISTTKELCPENILSVFNILVYNFL